MPRNFTRSERAKLPHPAYLVFPQEGDNEVIRLAVQGLRELGRAQQAAPVAAAV